MHCTQPGALSSIKWAFESAIELPIRLLIELPVTLLTEPSAISPRKFFRCLSLASALLVASNGFAAEEEPAEVEIDFNRLIFEAELLPAADQLPAANGEAGIAATQAAPVPPQTVQRETVLPGPIPGGAATRPPLLHAPATPAAEAPADADAIPRYESEIGRMLETAGPYSDALREQYESLAELYQRSGDHEKAITNFESAMHIERVNEGLFTLRQISLVENIIESYIALADIDEVDDHQEYLYYIQQKSYAEDDPRLLAAKEAWADWNVESYLKTGARGGVYPQGLSFSSNMNRPDYVAIQNPNNGQYIFVPRNQMPNVLTSSGAMANATISDFYMRSSTYSISPEQIIDERLRRARDLYGELIDSPNQDYQNTRAPDVEYKLANIAYAVKQQFDELESRAEENSLSFNRFSAPRSTNPTVTQGYTKSRESLEAIATKLEQAPDSSPLQTAQAYINLGDLHLGFDRVSRSEDAYLKALGILASAQTTNAEISSLFNPKPLIPVPGFALHPYSREFFGMTPDAPLDYKGYMDVTLAIDRSGDVKDLRIVATTENTTPRLRAVLLDYLREHRMRPVVQDGMIIDRFPMTLRIHYSY